MATPEASNSMELNRHSTFKITAGARNSTASEIRIDCNSAAGDGGSGPSGDDRVVSFIVLDA